MRREDKARDTRGRGATNHLNARAHTHTCTSTILANLTSPTTHPTSSAAAAPAATASPAADGGGERRRSPVAAVGKGRRGRRRGEAGVSGTGMAERGQAQRPRGTRSVPSAL